MVYIFIVGGIFAASGAVVAGISTAITGIQSTQLPESQTEDRQMLLASAALIGFGTLALIVALILLFIYMVRASRGVKKKSLIITVWILFAIFAAAAITGGVLAGVVGNKPENEEFRGALITAAVLPVVALVLFMIAFFILRKAAKVKGL